MSKWVYISADYSPTDGDRNVIDVLHGRSENRHYCILGILASEYPV